MKEVTIHLLHPDARVAHHGTRCTLQTPDFGQGCEVEVLVDKGQAMRIEARRGLTTSNELYWVSTDSGALVLTDHFARAAAALPTRNRELSEHAVLDHLLFRTTPGTGTPLRGVDRLGHGEAVTWKAPDWTPIRSRHATLTLPESLDFTLGVDRVEAALAEAVGDQTAPGTGALVNLLSGGVDSTLLHTFLGAKVRSASAGIDSAEFAVEIQYAQAAASLLGTDHAFTSMRESEYCSRLLECVTSSGLPPHHLQTVLLDLIFRGASTGTRFVTAQFADGLFGLDRAGPALQLHRMGSAALLLRASRIIPGRLGARVRVASSIRESLAPPPRDPRSYAAGFAVYGDSHWVTRAFGELAVQNRLEARVDYLQRVIPIEEWGQATTGAHLTLGHLMDFFMDDTVSIWRQVAHARGVGLVAPFTHPAVVHAALQIPALERYGLRGSAKPALKSLLARRLPPYPVHQVKGASGLPVARMIRDGSLACLPTEETAALLRDAQSSLPFPTDGDGRGAWAALSLGVWWASVPQIEVASRGLVRRFSQFQTDTDPSIVV